MMGEPDRIMKKQPRATMAWAPPIALAALACLVSCGEKNAYAPPPPPPVDVQPPLVQTVTVYQSFSARTDAFETYEARTRVTGFIESIGFDDGAYVEEDDILFKIDPIQFDAAVTRATGERDKAAAQLALAQTNFEKRRDASVSGAISKIDVATAEAEMNVAAAELAIKTAALLDAETEQGYTVIRTKISGWVSRTQVDRGNLVSGTEGTLLATVIRDDPLYAIFEVSERKILDRLPMRTPENPQEPAEKLLRLVTTDGRRHLHKGSFHSIANEIDSDTGTIQVITLFPNPDRRLAAGLSVKVERPLEKPDAVLIPRAVIQGDIGGSYVLVLRDGNVATRRPVEISEFTLGDLAIISSGLGAADLVIVNNLQRVRDGVAVNPREIARPTLPADPDEDPDSPPVEPAPGTAK
jgi:RND family efflux transporter MFP subunit